MREPRISGSGCERFSGLLDESLDTAAARAREIAGIIAESSNEGVQSIEQQYDLVRKTSDEERLRTSEALNSIYDEASAEVQAMFTQTAGRFTEIMQGMKQMAAEMQRELETTRTELRRGILELPQETAESTAQMRRVIVDQIEALAELNRIVARHGRSLDAAEPVRREAEPLFAAGGGRAPAAPRPRRCGSAAAAGAGGARHHRRADAARQSAQFEPGARRQGRQCATQRRLAVRSPDACVTRRQSADRPARRSRAVARRRTAAAREHRFDRFAIGGYRADDRPRGRR